MSKIKMRALPYRDHEVESFKDVEGNWRCSVTDMRRTFLSVTPPSPSQGDAVSFARAFIDDRIQR